PLSSIQIFPERTATAQVVSLNESRMAAEISARILKINVEAGQVIAKGAVIAQLDCADYNIATERALAALRVSQANAKLAEVQLTRNQKLAEQKFISASGLDTQVAQTEAAQAEVAVNQAAVKTARNNQSKCQIRSPFPAIVLERIAQVGEIVAPGGAIVLLRDSSTLEIKAEIQEKDAALEGVDTFEFVTLSGRYPLRLLRLSPAASRTTRLLEARFKFAGDAAASGSSGRLAWVTKVPHLPANFVLRRNGQLGVFVLKQDKPVFVPIANAEEGRPAVVPDLPVNTQIITKGHESL
ncbi:MAG: efflux RND transporter periplasmic adaptor subunit, partial [Nitrosomonadales bacterium]|nr:efflux RND transporter periplasmic adaptor subunit [Nitrosomonadales bacterium]